MRLNYTVEELDPQKAIWDEAGMLHTLTRDSRGKIRGISAVYAIINVDGVRYSAEKHVKLRFKKQPPAK